MARRTRFDYARDGNSVVLLEPANFKSVDETPGTAVASPRTVTSSTVLVLTIPQAALTIQIQTTADLYAGRATAPADGASYTAAQFASSDQTITIPAGTQATLPVAGKIYLGLRAVSTTSTVKFLFFTTEVEVN